MVPPPPPSKQKPSKEDQGLANLIPQADQGQAEGVGALPWFPHHAGPERSWGRSVPSTCFYATCVCPPSPRGPCPLLAGTPPPQMKRGLNGGRLLPPVPLSPGDIGGVLCPGKDHQHSGQRPDLRRPGKAAEECHTPPPPAPTPSPPSGPPLPLPSFSRENGAVQLQTAEGQVAHRMPEAEWASLVLWFHSRDPR